MLWLVLLLYKIMRQYLTLFYLGHWWFEGISYNYQQNPFWSDIFYFFHVHLLTLKEMLLLSSSLPLHQPGMKGGYPRIIFNTSIELAVLPMLPSKILREPPYPQETLKIAMMCIPDFITYKIFLQWKYGFTWYIWIYIYVVQYMVFLDLYVVVIRSLAFKWLFLLWLHQNLPCTLGGMVGIWQLPNFCWIHHQSQKSPKLVMFGLDNLCAATKTLGNLIKVQQTWHGWKHNTLLSIAFRYSKINWVCSIRLALL